jgi:hypothetical protein
LNPFKLQAGILVGGHCHHHPENQGRWGKSTSISKVPKPSLKMHNTWASEGLFFWAKKMHKESGFMPLQASNKHDLRKGFDHKFDHS